MAVQVQSPPLIRHRFDVAEYEAMLRAGVFGEDDRIELIEGELLEMSPIGPDHAGIVNRLNRLFARRLGERALVAVQNPLRLDAHTEPQPDLMLLRPRPDDYRRSHPGPTDVLALVEVSDTTLTLDRQTKLPLYARAGIGEVWLVNLLEVSLEVYRAPEGGAYRERQVKRLGEDVTLHAFADVALNVGDILL